MILLDYYNIRGHFMCKTSTSVVHLLLSRSNSVIRREVPLEQLTRGPTLILVEAHAGKSASIFANIFLDPLVFEDEIS